VAETKKPNANVAAAQLLEHVIDVLVVYRTPRRPSKSIPKKPEQGVELIPPDALYTYLFPEADSEGRAPEGDERHLVSENSLLLIPVARKFADVGRRLEILFEFTPPQVERRKESESSP